MFLGIEIGGTKLQLGVGPDDGKLRGLWRGTVDPAAGATGIQQQISVAVPELLQRAGVRREELRGAGIGFGGPVDDATRTVITSHQIEGWDNFPLADWIADLVGLPAVLGNDADVAGLAEALHGAGKGLSPIFYITIGSGIGGGLIIAGEIYRGVGRGAAEVGHLLVDTSEVAGWQFRPLEEVASGWGIAEHARRHLSSNPQSLLHSLCPDLQTLTAEHVAEAARRGDIFAHQVLSRAITYLSMALGHVIALLCPRRIVVGGGVSLLGEGLLFQPLRVGIRTQVFAPFAGLSDVVPASLGEEVVVHGAVALARKKLG